MSRLAVLMSFILFVGSAVAHEQKTAVTQVLLNERSGKLEVVHRIRLHDAEHALKDLLDIPGADIHSQVKAQGEFTRYVLKHFALEADGVTLNLELVGFEVEGKFLWVYQEHELDNTWTSFRAQQATLRDHWPEQRNLVNFEKGGEVKSLEFSGDDEWLSVAF